MAAFSQLAYAKPATPSILNTALILGDSVTAGGCDPAEVGGHCNALQSLEEQQAQILGYTTTVVTGAQWGALAASDFAKYQVLIIGDPTCGGLGSFAAAAANASTWEPVVMASAGNKVVIGTDPTFHRPSHVGAETLEKNGIAFAGTQTGSTGAYIDLTCAYSGAPNQVVPLLDGLSTAGPNQFFVEGVPCLGNIAIVAATGPTAGLHDIDLSGWSCSVHESFTKWGPDYNVLALATDAPAKPYCANDVDTGLLACGEPYILASGSGIVITSEISLAPLTATNPVGTSHTVTATVKKGGLPEAGKLVSFIVSSGPNAGKAGSTGSGTTDVNGQTTFTYTDVGGAGTDTISASFTNDAGAIETATATKTWVGPTVTSTSTSTSTATSTATRTVTVTPTVTRAVTITPTRTPTPSCEKEDEKDPKVAAAALAEDGKGEGPHDQPECRDRSAATLPVAGTPTP